MGVREMNDMVNSNRGVQRPAALALAGVALCLAAWATTTRAETVAMVTDVIGRVFVQGSATHNNIAILADIEPDARMQLESGARLVVLYLQSGDEYAFTGPAQVQFRPNGPQVAGGTPPRKRARSKLDVTIKPTGVTPGALVMRGTGSLSRIKLLNLTGTQTLETAPEFRWRDVEPAVRYQFELNDETGKSLFEIQIEGVALKLPPNFQLEEGIDYKWTVSSRLSDGRRYVNSGNFSVAPADLRARAEVLRPASGAPVAERVAFAVWLAQSRLNDEARKYWKALANERPEDPRLRALAAE